jgi:hypothetical protein
MRTEIGQKRMLRDVFHGRKLRFIPHVANGEGIFTRPISLRQLPDRLEVTGMHASMTRYVLLPKRYQIHTLTIVQESNMVA